MLGGNAEFLADAQLQKQGLDPIEHAEAYEEAWPETLAAFTEQVAAEHDEVVAAGGLYVVGSERHESRRIDNQLRGRSGRQGDPGESRFYLSLTDELMRRFNAEAMERAMAMFNVPDEQPIEHKWISKSIETAQKTVESMNTQMRENVLKYDDVMNRQRHTVYKDRRKVLNGADVSAELQGAVQRVVSEAVAEATTGFVEDWDLDHLWKVLGELYPISLSIDDYDRLDLTSEELEEDVTADAQRAYDTREDELGSERMRDVERQALLVVLDRQWREHLYEMDYLREGIGLRAMAQRDPLVEYKNEGALMFQNMMEAFMEEVVRYLFNFDVETVTAQLDASDLGLVKPVKDEQAMTYSGPSETGEAEQRGETKKSAFSGVGRNQKCPCGSGKKFKVCHGRS